ncbi:mycofactocin-coupled SDR family oxidoreductase [Actinospica sp. MGRD01-02]|uniref:Mycofactocin-coupled SDR family oxidoreductase n=2 Tax=Actinospica acidithermotolerans TaxID=2828514 RepID=A0A941IHF8_9ACTN|nr:mycofactocin-coupled SDR family oxidoreductase [Actinospica acidithermotolerans]
MESYEPPVPAQPNARRYVGKVAFITGAARGQGRAEAVRLAAEGADIIALDLCEDIATTTYQGSTPEDLAETANLVEKLGRRVVTIQSDTRDFRRVKEGLVSAVAELGRLDVVIANAGMTSGALSWEIDEEHWDVTIGMNLTGAFHTAKAAIPILLEQGTGGSITFTGSVAGRRGLPFLADYVAAKHGVVGLSKALANELAPHWIRCNTVHPFGVQSGLQMTEITDLLKEHDVYRPMFSPALPAYISQPEDIAAAVAWIASDEARHVTGIELPVDLGRTNR